jgi:hypothetical protein
MPTRVFPTPQEIEVTNQPFISADFRITGLKSVDSVAISFLKEILPFGSTKKAIPIKISLLKEPNGNISFKKDIATESTDLRPVILKSAEING